MVCHLGSTWYLQRGVLVLQRCMFLVEVIELRLQLAHLARGDNEVTRLLEASEMNGKG